MENPIDYEERCTECGTTYDRRYDSECPECDSNRRKEDALWAKISKLNMENRELKKKIDLVENRLLKRKINFTLEILELQIKYLTAIGSEDQFLINRTTELIKYLQL